MTPHPATDLRVVYREDPEPELFYLEALRGVPEPRWLGVWSRPYGDRLVRVIRPLGAAEAG